MHFLRRKVVCRRLCRGNHIKNVISNIFCRFRHVTGGNNFPDFRKSSVAVSVVMFFFMTVAVVVFFFMTVTVFMSFFITMAVVVFFSMTMAVIMTVQILHIMVMIFMKGIEDHIKIAAVYPRFLHPPDLGVKTVVRNRLQSSFQCFQIRSEINHGRYKHVSADTGRTIKIQFFIHRCSLFLQGG